MIYMWSELLEEKWKEEGVVERKYAVRDQEILRKFDNLIDHTEVHI